MILFTWRPCLAEGLLSQGIQRTARPLLLEYSASNEGPLRGANVQRR